MRSRADGGADAASVIVSNRGPAQFERDEAGERVVSRGGGGLVTALSGLVSHREALWIASAMTDEDVAVSREAAGEPVDRRAGRDRLRGAAGRERRRGLRPLLQRDREPDPVVHPALPLGPLERARHPPRGGRTPGSTATRVVNDDIAERGAAADRGRRRAAGDAPRLPPLHLPGADPRGAPRRASCTTSSTSRGRSPTAGGSSRRGWREEIYRGLLANDIIGFHTTAYCRNFLHCCRELMELEVDYERGAVLHDGPRDLGPRLPARDRRRTLASAPPPRRRSPSTSRSCCAAAATT